MPACISPDCSSCPEIPQIPQLYNENEVPFTYVYIEGFPEQPLADKKEINNVQSLLDCATLCSNNVPCETFWYHGVDKICFIRELSGSIQQSTQ